MKRTITEVTKLIAALAFATFLSINMAGCDHSNKTLNGSQDTSSVNRAGGPPITDTASISKAEKEATHDSLKKDTTSKGNVDPKGYVKKQ
ncbi:MAG: hypothetical protein ABIN91_06460 [Mucilaginibacter sp.]|uniref:hypothetical protein n=1 Tax=Mucilaginibacter sp. TaxID=1882438 RepID=UPI0032658F02